MKQRPRIYYTQAQIAQMRLAEAEDRAVPGYWDGDLLFGSNNSQIATLVEPYTRYVMLVRVPSKDTETVINVLIKHAHNLPRELYKSLTRDCGSEIADHQKFSLATDIKNAVARRLNERPRKTLGYYSPAERFAEHVAAID